MANGESKGPEGGREADDKQGMSPYARAMADMAPFLGIGTVFAASIGLFAWLGWLLDKKLGTNQWCLLAGSLFGVGIGFLNFFKVVLSLNQRKGK